MMKNIVSKMVTASLISCAAISFAHAADENASKAEIKKQIQICAKKKQGDWVTYANKGVTYNGSCEPNESGKLQFSFPAPNGGTSASTAPVAAEPTLENRPAVEQAPAAAPEAPTNSDANQVEQPATQQPNQAEQPTEAPIQAQ